MATGKMLSRPLQIDAQAALHETRSCGRSEPEAPPTSRGLSSDNVSTSDSIIFFAAPHTIPFARADAMLGGAWRMAHRRSL